MNATIRNYLKNADPKLATIFPEVELNTIESHNDIYLDLIGSIISQQLSVKAAATIEARFLDLFSDGYPHPEKVLEMEVAELREVGLSFQKGGYIQNVARAFSEEGYEKKDWLNMPDEEIIKELTLIKGVGKWTVEMILMFRLDRPDVFPIDDLGIRQGMVWLYEVEETGKALYPRLIEIAEAWRPYRTYACRCLWRWKDFQKMQKPV